MFLRERGIMMIDDEKWPPGKIIISGGKVFDRCANCGKIVQVNKGIFGSFHLCVPQEERENNRKGNKC